MSAFEGKARLPRTCRSCPSMSQCGHSTPSRMRTPKPRISPSSSCRRPRSVAVPIASGPTASNRNHSSRIRPTKGRRRRRLARGDLRNGHDESGSSCRHDRSRQPCDRSTRACGRRRRSKPRERSSHRPCVRHPYHPCHRGHRRDRVRLRTRAAIRLLVRLGSLRIRPSFVC
jgi:hypothetical protein